MAEEKKPLWYENKIKYQREYAKKQIKQIKFELNIVHDKDILDFLDTKENKQGYIKSLIRADMEAHK